MYDTYTIHIWDLHIWDDINTPFIHTTFFGPNAYSCQREIKNFGIIQFHVFQRIALGSPILESPGTSVENSASNQDLLNQNLRGKSHNKAS